MQLYMKKKWNEFSLLFLFLFYPHQTRPKRVKFMVKQSTLKQADIPHTNRVLIKKDVNVNHVWQYKDKGMCNRLGVVGDVDADMCVWYCLYICGTVLIVWNCTSCLNVPNKTYIHIYIVVQVMTISVTSLILKRYSKMSFPCELGKNCKEWYQYWESLSVNSHFLGQPRDDFTLTLGTADSSNQPIILYLLNFLSPAHEGKMWVWHRAGEFIILWPFYLCHWCTVIKIMLHGNVL